jgi:hypothetical protein
MIFIGVYWWVRNGHIKAGFERVIIHVPDENSVAETEKTAGRRIMMVNRFN